MRGIFGALFCWGKLDRLPLFIRNNATCLIYYMFIVANAASIAAT